MRTTISVDDQTFETLMQLTGTTNKSEAVKLAIDEFIRRERLKRFRALRGKVDIMSNEEIEAVQLERAERLSEG
jgi:Arc/MetJ family transcription regulator